jgi:SAM-dependent methyltransferase
LNNINQDKPKRTWNYPKWYIRKDTRKRLEEVRNQYEQDKNFQAFINGFLDQTLKIYFQYNQNSKQYIYDDLLIDPETIKDFLDLLKEVNGKHPIVKRFIFSQIDEFQKKIITSVRMGKEMLLNRNEFRDFIGILFNTKTSNYYGITTLNPSEFNIYLSEVLRAHENAIGINITGQSHRILVLNSYALTEDIRERKGNFKNFIDWHETKRKKKVRLWLIEPEHIEWIKKFCNNYQPRSFTMMYLEGVCLVLLRYKEILQKTEDPDEKIIGVRIIFEQENKTDDDAEEYNNSIKFIKTIVDKQQYSDNRIKDLCYYSSELLKNLDVFPKHTSELVKAWTRLVNGEERLKTSEPFMNAILCKITDKINLQKRLKILDVTAGAGTEFEYFGKKGYNIKYNEPDPKLFNEAVKSFENKGYKFDITEDNDNAEKYRRIISFDDNNTKMEMFNLPLYLLRNNFQNDKFDIVLDIGNILAHARGKRQLFDQIDYLLDMVQPEGLLVIDHRNCKKITESLKLKDEDKVIKDYLNRYNSKYMYCGDIVAAPSKKEDEMIKLEFVEKNSINEGKAIKKIPSDVYMMEVKVKELYDYLKNKKDKVAEINIYLDHNIKKVISDNITNFKESGEKEANDFFVYIIRVK